LEFCGLARVLLAGWSLAAGGIQAGGARDRRATKLHATRPQADVSGLFSGSGRRGLFQNFSFWSKLYQAVEKVDF
jgi:hypothetical protein